MTQLNPDGTTRDFVDYDSNLLAAAFVPMSNERRRSILRRIDAGNCTHAAPGTYISEKLYGPKDVYSCDAAKPEIQCVGDSRVSYGRVAWLDAITRKLVGDHDAFERLCIAPIRSEVFKLYELRLFLYFIIFLSSFSFLRILDFVWKIKHTDGVPNLFVIPILMQLYCSLRSNMC